MKPIVLFNFGYHRRSWIEPIEALEEKIEIVYLFFIDKSLDKNSFTKKKVIYWNQFKSADDLLNYVKPEKIVLMSLFSGLEILLNYCAKKRNIRTFILQHGMYSNYKDYRSREESRIDRIPGVENSLVSFRTIDFFRNSLNYRDVISFILFPFYYFLLKRKGFWVASKLVKFDARKPDFYICYTAQNAKIHLELDNPKKSQLFYIGIPDLEKYFKHKHLHNSNVQPYYLLIDQPFAENQFGEVLFSINDIKNHYEKLLNYARSNEAVLKIKLHPENYNASWIPDLQGLEFIRDYSNLPELIASAKGCFGYFSTLMLPAIFLNDCVLFKVSENEFQKDVSSLGLATLLEFKSYSVDDIYFPVKRSNNLDVFIKKYIGDDSESPIRKLEEILLRFN